MAIEANALLAELDTCKAFVVLESVHKKQPVFSKQKQFVVGRCICELIGIQKTVKGFRDLSASNPKGRFCVDRKSSFSHLD